MTKISEIGRAALMERLAKEAREKEERGKRKEERDLFFERAAPLPLGEGAVERFEASDKGVDAMESVLLMEGVHFDLTYTTPAQVGRRAVVAAMAKVVAKTLSRPSTVCLSVAVGRRATVEDLEETCRGARSAAESLGVCLRVGDVTSSLTGMAVSATAAHFSLLREGGQEGRTSNSTVRPSTLKETDLLVVTGDLGAAYMGGLLLEREKRVYYSQLMERQKKRADFGSADIPFKPDFAGREYLIERALSPNVPSEPLERLSGAGVRPSAVVLVSDGLASALLHLCHEHKVGCRVYEERLPIDYETAVTAEEMNMNLTTAALHGGDDMELLMAIPLGDYERIRELEGVKPIGHIVEQALGSVLVTRDGGEFSLTAQDFATAPRD